MQEQVQRLEEDLEKEAFEREKIESSYEKKLNEEKLMYDEKVWHFVKQHSTYFNIRSCLMK